MNCPHCGEGFRGETCRCHLESAPPSPGWRTDAEWLEAESPSASGQRYVRGPEFVDEPHRIETRLIDSEIPDFGERYLSEPDLIEQRFAASLDVPSPPAPDLVTDCAETSEALPVVAAADSALRPEPAPSIANPDSSSEPETDAWRDELSARLNRYRSRRKMRPPRYPSLQLQFEAVESFGASGLNTGSSTRTFEPVSDRALALDGMREMPSAVADSYAQPAAELTAHPFQQAEPAPVERSGAKIIEFPRFAWGPPPPPDNQLAEPVMDRPRILEVPDAAPPPPALGGITIDAAERQKAEKRPGIDFPLQAASLPRRVLAGIVDALIVGAASAFFGSVFWKVTSLRPPLIQILGLAVAIPYLCWMAYQYLVIVYTAATPGLRAAGLKLARFDGAPPSRSLRRWRVLASCLSAASLGMGYLWVFLDEDALCWHDRITHTYLAPEENQSRSKATA
jgi:uncharacterized RDD family membrane protein YckC